HFFYFVSILFHLFLLWNILGSFKFFVAVTVGTSYNWRQEPFILLVRRLIKTPSTFTGSKSISSGDKGGALSIPLISSQVFGLAVDPFAVCPPDKALT
ncbi:MAG: hypothetical protein V3V43_04560, partial [Dehalococcoidales bacterium]